MPDITKLKISWFDYRTDVPSWVSSGIGQINVEWSVVERELEEMIRLLMDVDIQAARIIANWMNARTRIITAEYLIQAHVINSRLKPIELETIIDLNGIKKLQPKRDVVAHGLWGKHEGKWCVLKLRQTRSTPELQPDLKKLGRAVIPQREPMTKASLTKIAGEIAAFAKKIVSFCDHLERELSPLQSTRPVYTRRSRDYRPKTKKTAP